MYICVANQHLWRDWYQDREQTDAWMFLLWPSIKESHYRLLLYLRPSVQLRHVSPECSIAENSNFDEIIPSHVHLTSHLRAKRSEYKITNGPTEYRNHDALLLLLLLLLL